MATHKTLPLHPIRPIRSRPKRRRHLEQHLVAGKLTKLINQRRFKKITTTGEGGWAISNRPSFGARVDEHHVPE